MTVGFQRRWRGPQTVLCIICSHVTHRVLFSAVYCVKEQFDFFVTHHSEFLSQSEFWGRTSLSLLSSDTKLSQLILCILKQFLYVSSGKHFRNDVVLNYNRLKWNYLQYIYILKEWLTVSTYKSTYIYNGNKKNQIFYRVQRIYWNKDEGHAFFATRSATPE